MKTEHTKGPWHKDTAEANAKLAAAAPELLENEVENLDFLRWVSTQLRDFNMMSDKRELLYKRIAATEAAIKKATE